MPQISSQHQIHVLNGATLQRFSLFIKKYCSTNLIFAWFWLFWLLQATLRTKSVQNASNFFPAPNSWLKWSHFAKIGSYTMILFIFKEILLYQPDFCRILVILAILCHFWVKKCAKCLKFLPSPKFMSQMEPLCKNWILFNDFFHF